LAKRTVAMALDGTLADITDPIERDARIEFISREDPRALELIRHDTAHVLAEAVQTLWPGTQVTIGPVIENGFIDFFRNQPFTPRLRSSKKMREIVARDKPLHQGGVDATRRENFPRHGRGLQGRADRCHPRRSMMGSTT
jgi:threonyl-tRNA synthetase